MTMGTRHISESQLVQPQVGGNSRESRKCVVLGLLSRHQEAGYWAVLYENGYYYRSNTEGCRSTVTAMLRVAQALTEWRTQPTRLCHPFNPPPSPSPPLASQAQVQMWLHTLLDSTRLVVLFPTTTRLDGPLSWEHIHRDWNNQNQALLFVSLCTRYKGTKWIIFRAWTFYQFLTIYWSKVTNFAT